MRNKLIAIALLVIGPVMGFFGFKDKLEFDKIQADGVNVAGVITDGEAKRSRRGGKTYYFTIRYVPANGQAQSKSFSVPREYFEERVRDNTLHRTDTEVRYLPGEPARAFVVGTKDDSMLVIYLGAGLFLVGAVLTFVFFRKKTPTSA